MKTEECFFVDSSFEKSNIYKTYCKFNFENIVLSNKHQKKIYEGESNNYFKILKNDNKYKLFYRASNNKYMINNKFNNNYDYDLENLCLAESKDGLNFEKVKINRNNIIMKNNFCHNFFPNFINNKYYAISGTYLNNNGLFLFNSKNGINWNKGTKFLDNNHILKFIKHKNHFDTHNSINYNHLDKFFYIHLRHNNYDDKRMVQLVKTHDFKYFLNPKLISVDHSFNYEIYNANICKLDEYKFFISLPNYAKNKYISTNDNKNNFLIKLKYVKDILISLDGVNFFTFIPDIKLKNMNNNSQICPVNGIIKSPNKKKIYFYFQNNVHTQNHEIQCYSIPYNRFINNYTIGYGYIKSKLINFKNMKIEINFKTLKKKSFIVVEILNSDEKRVNISKILKGDVLKEKVQWFNNFKNEQDNYIIKFHLFNAGLFSFNYNLNTQLYIDFIWSKGVYKRTDYMLKHTNSHCEEDVIINQIKNDKNYIWIRNSSTTYKIKNKDLDYLINNINKLNKNKMIIITDGDNPLPSSYDLDQFKKLIECKFVKKIYLQNYDLKIKHRKLRHYPIGLDLHTPKYLLEFNYQQKIDYYLDVRNSSMDYILNKILCDSHLSNTHDSRKIMYKKLRRNRYIDFLNEKLNIKEIIKKYRNYKFVLSPRGHGLDCHRTWELFLLGCIVITETSPLDNMWIKHELPVVILNDFNELNLPNINLKLEFWFKRYKHLTSLKNIYPKFKNSYWLKM